jgi:hypothetical protein
MSLNKVFTFGAGMTALHPARKKRNDLRYRESVWGTMIDVTAGCDGRHLIW